MPDRGRVHPRGVIPRDAWLPARRGVLFDLALVLALEALLLLVLWPMADAGSPWGLTIQAALVLALLLRRVFPLSLLAVMLASTVALFVLGRLAPEVPGLVLGAGGARVALAVPFAIYSAVVYGHDRRVAWLMTAGIGVLVARPDDPSVDLAIGAVLVAALPGLLGQYVAGLNDRLERAEREQHRIAEQARVEERVRLAGEMHDVVTHRVSLMVLQAGALGVTAQDPATRAAADDLRAAGCQALEELRDLVGVLRSAPGEGVADVADLAPVRAGGQAPTMDIAELLDTSRSVGLAVRHVQEGDPTLASPVVRRTTYRVVQEALTNVHKHAPGATTEVSVRYQRDRVELSVRNTAPTGPADPGLTASGSGTGLIGLRQRVELVSGTLRADPTDDGGFEVVATLPAFVPTPERPADPEASERPVPLRGGR
jgi:signal transduction histidine kinase